MRRISLTTEQAAAIAELITTQRTELRLSTREVSLRSGVNVRTINNLEHGEIRSPQPDTIVDLAHALNLTASDLFALAGWIPAAELPTLKPYLRAKYDALDEAALSELEAYAQKLAERHGGRGPIDHEDEQP